MSSEKVAESWLVALQNLVAVRSPLAPRLYRRLKDKGEFTSRQRQRIERLSPWISLIEASPRPPAVFEGEIPIGVMGYKATDLSEASRNIGDWVQTIAMMSHFVKCKNVTFEGDDEVSNFFRRLQANTPANKQLEGPEARLRLIEINRDASAYDTIPQGTLAFIFGWFMKRPFGGPSPFPMNEKILPIFISFHISRADFLTDQTVEYLTQNAPIGCRDLHTTKLLTEAGVPAYFSGCVTTTVGNIFPQPALDENMPMAYVDTPAPEHGTNITELTNLDNELRNTSLAQGLELAAERLNDYRTKYSSIATSRLHTYLPAWSLGAQVDWRAKDANDRRFGGLVGEAAESPANMAERVTHIAGSLVNAILSQKSHDDVLALHRELASAHIEQAQKQWAR